MIAIFSAQRLQLLVVTILMVAAPPSVRAARTTWVGGAFTLASPPLGLANYQTQFSVTCDFTTGLVWSQAYGECEERSADGWAIASIPTVQAMNAIRGIVSNQHIYVGATDAVTESKWMIAAGRYTHRQFYQGQVTGSPGVCVLPGGCFCSPGFYCSWTSWSPDNAGIGEHYGEIWANEAALNDYPGNVVPVVPVHCYACERSMCNFATDCNTANSISVSIKYQRGGEPCGCVCKPGFTGPRCDITIALHNVQGLYLTWLTVHCSPTALPNVTSKSMCPSAVGWEVLSVPTVAATFLHATVNTIAPGMMIWARDSQGAHYPVYPTPATSIPSFYWAAAPNPNRVFCVACERRLCADVTQMANPLARLASDRPMGGFYPNCSVTPSFSNTPTHTKTSVISVGTPTTSTTVTPPNTPSLSELETTSESATRSLKETPSSTAPQTKSLTPSQTPPGATLTASDHFSTSPSNPANSPSLTQSDSVFVSDASPSATTTRNATLTASLAATLTVMPPLPPCPPRHPSQPQEPQAAVTGIAPPPHTAGGRTEFRIPTTRLGAISSSSSWVLVSMSAWQCFHNGASILSSSSSNYNHLLPMCELLPPPNATTATTTSTALLSCDITYPSLPEVDNDGLSSGGPLICSGMALVGCDNVSLSVTQWSTSDRAASAVVVVVALGAAASASAILLGDPTTVEMPACAVMLMSPCGSAATHDAGRIAQYIVSPLHATGPAAAIGATIGIVAGVIAIHAAFVSLRVMRSPSHKIAGFFPSWWPEAAFYWFPSFPFAVAAALYPGVAWAVAASTHGDYRNPAAAVFGCLYLLAVPSAGAFILMRLPPRLFLTHTPEEDDEVGHAAQGPITTWRFVPEGARPAATATATAQHPHDKHRKAAVVAFLLRQLRPVGSFMPFHPGERAVGWVRGLAAGHAGRPVGATTAALCLCVAVVWLAAGAPRGTSCAPRLYAACALLVVYAITVALWRPYRVAAVNVLTVVAAAAAGLVAVGVAQASTLSTTTSAADHEKHVRVVSAGAVIVAVATVLRAACTLGARILEARAHSTRGGRGSATARRSENTLLDDAEVALREL